MDKEKSIRRFLRNIDDDDHNPECNRRQFCPKHKDCGICRFEYMKKRGWLFEEKAQ